MAGTSVAPVPILLDLEKLDFGYTIAEPSEKLLGMMGQQAQLVLRGSMFVTDVLQLPLVYTMHGPLQEVDFGNWKKGSRSGVTKAKHPLTLYIIEVAGEEVFYCDNVNGILRVMGKDLTAMRRANLGLV